MGFPGGTVVKNLPANAGDTGDPGLMSVVILNAHQREKCRESFRNTFLATHSPCWTKELQHEHETYLSEWNSEQSYLTVCFSWALIRFKVEEKNSILQLQTETPLGLFCALISEHHSHEYRMKSSVKSVMQTCIFLLLFAVCLYIASKSHHIPLSPFQMSQKDTHFSHAWHPDYFFPNALQEKNTRNVLFGQNFFFFFLSNVFF